METVDWIVIISGVVVGLIIGLIIRRKNIEYLKSDTKLGQSKQVLRLGKPPTPNSPLHHHLPSVKGSANHFQSSELHQEQETNRIKHEPNSECGDCQETIE